MQKHKNLTNICVSRVKVSWGACGSGKCAETVYELIAPNFVESCHEKHVKSICMICGFVEKSLHHRMPPTWSLVFLDSWGLVSSGLRRFWFLEVALKIKSNTQNEPHVLCFKNQTCPGGGGWLPSAPPPSRFVCL